jgi:MoaA/NifB/PqqE/SkfB family radical SAM enzyme
VASEFDFVNSEHFRPAADHDAAMRLFQQSVSMVEVEVFSYCNRRCWFCPNSTSDRISSNILMPPALYSGILQQLALIDYDKTISYSRFNEPLADRIILDRIREAHRILPRAHLHTNTNGDYLSCAYLDELYTAGLRSLNIQVYLQNEDRYDHSQIESKMQLIIKKLGFPSARTIDKPDEWLESRLTFRDMQVRLYGRNFAINGCSRGNSLDIRRDYVRTHPCISPFCHVYIDYNGKMMPCCNLRSDLPEHAQYVTHDLAQDLDIFAAYSQSPLVQWRRGLIGWEEKQGVCKSCAFDMKDKK